MVLMWSARGAVSGLRCAQVRESTQEGHIVVCNSIAERIVWSNICRRREGSSSCYGPQRNIYDVVENPASIRKAGDIATE